jgi:ribosome-binding protein aMBF1 (putative translation factor)
LPSDLQTKKSAPRRIFRHIKSKDDIRMDLEYSKAVGAAIRAARLARGMTQAQLTGCDLTRSALAKIECGQRSVYPDE